MSRYTTGPRDEEVAGFILGLLVDRPRLSNEIHVLTEKYFGVTYKELAGPREILGERIETGRGGGPEAGRAKYWELASDVAQADAPS
jgi:hypothetical protein